MHLYKQKFIKNGTSNSESENYNFILDITFNSMCTDRE